MNASQTKAVSWIGDAETGYLQLIDQTLLPREFKLLEIKTVEQAWEAIKALRVRGAPAIGVSAAFAYVIGARQKLADQKVFDRSIAKEVSDYLRTSRPTAVNLFWALDRMDERMNRLPGDCGTSRALMQLLEEAEAIRNEDEAMCVAIGKHGVELMPRKGSVLTHCNTGALATADYGTALSVIFHAHSAGKAIHVYVDETRPLLQGSRLTAWELMQRNVSCTLICDNMAGFLMKQGRISAAIVGADRITANGDTANKIGTYSVAALCSLHKIPFYVAAPSSTFDLSLATGDQIPIEERAASEITNAFGKPTAPENVPVYNPAFDVTPGSLVTAFVTEKGILKPPYDISLRALAR